MQYPNSGAALRGSWDGVANIINVSVANKNRNQGGPTLCQEK